MLHVIYDSAKIVLPKFLNFKDIENILCIEALSAIVRNLDQITDYKDLNTLESQLYIPVWVESLNPNFG